MSRFVVDVPFGFILLALSVDLWLIESCFDRSDRSKCFWLLWMVWSSIQHNRRRFQVNICLTPLRSEYFDVFLCICIDILNFLFQICLNISRWSFLDFWWCDLWLSPLVCVHLEAFSRSYAYGMLCRDWEHLYGGEDNWIGIENVNLIVAAFKSIIICSER